MEISEEAREKREAYAAGGRTAAQDVRDVLMAHWPDYIGAEEGWACGCDEGGVLPPMPFQSDAIRHQAGALADAGLLRDDAEITSLHKRLADSERTIAELFERWRTRERERDDLLAMKARVEALADEWDAALTCGDEWFRDTEWARCLRVNLPTLRRAIRGDR